MTIKQQIEEELKKVLEGLNIDDLIPSVDYSANPNHGDYSTNVALIAAKKLGKNQIELGEEIAEKLKTENLKLKIFDKVEVAKPGFINFWIAREFLIQKLQNSIGKGLEIQKRGKGKKVIVEYSSPNIAKPFTIGHLRSTVIGDAIANLLEATGWTVYRDNHVGDWGTQFGKQIYAIKNWGNEEEINRSEQPVKQLVALYVKFHEEAEKNPELEERAREWFKKLEEGDIEAKRLWQKCVEWSWKEFDKIYQELGVKFTENNGHGYGEAFFEEKMVPVITELKEKGLLKVGKEGAQIVEFDEKTKLPPLMILKKDGATLYSTRDLATDKFRIERYGKSIMIINEVGIEQSLYFQQLYTLEELLGWVKKDQRVHIKHGLIRFKDGKMSTRKGNTIWLDDVLDEAEKKAFHLRKEAFEFEGSDVISTSNKFSKSAQKHVKGLGKSINTQKAVGIGAIKWNDLKRDSQQDIMFDWDEILNMQGNSGPYIQYVFARTQSVLAKAGVTSFKLQVTSFKLDLAPEERELLRLLVQFDEVIGEAAEKFAPNILTTYLFELAQAFNLFYQKHQIIKTEADIRDFRLFLTESTGQVIKKGLNLLGIESPEKM